MLWLPILQSFLLLSGWKSPIFSTLPYRWWSLSSYQVWYTHDTVAKESRRDTVGTSGKDLLIVENRTGERIAFSSCTGQFCIEGLEHRSAILRMSSLLMMGWWAWEVREERKKPKSREHQQFLRLHGKLLVRVMHMLVTLELFSLRSSFPLLLGVMAHCCFYLVCGLGIYWNVNKGIIILKTNYLINHCLNFYAL